MNNKIKETMFRGIECIICKDRDYENPLYPYKYNIRHSDYNEKKPCTIEKNVIVNYYCTILSKEMIPLNDGSSDDHYCELTPSEEKNIRILMI